MAKRKPATSKPKAPPVQEQQVVTLRVVWRGMLEMLFNVFNSGSSITKVVSNTAEAGEIWSEGLVIEAKADRDNRP